MRAFVSTFLLLSTFASAVEPLSDELRAFLEEAEYVIVCEKRGMKLIIIESLLGPQRVGDIQAIWKEEESLPGPHRIDPDETWKDLLVWLPGRKRLAYYRITDGSFKWFDATSQQNRNVTVDSLRQHFSKINKSPLPKQNQRP